MTGGGSPKTKVFTPIYWAVVVILFTGLSAYTSRAPACDWSDVACGNVNRAVFIAWYLVPIFAPLVYFAALVCRLGSRWKRRGLFAPIVVTRRRVVRTILVTLPLIPAGLAYLFVLFVGYELLKVAFLIGDCMEIASVCDAVAAQGQIIIPIVIGAAIVGFWASALYWVWIWWARADVIAETPSDAS